ncbi:MAG: hypothetical protein ACK5Q5_16205 [Planctomycetaceae bacterium]
MAGKRQRLVMALGISLLGATWLLQADDRPTATQEATPSPDDHDGWMKLKLVSSQQVFEGLTDGDFKKVENSARRMLVLNLLEQWAKRNEFTKKSEYRGQLNAFEFSVKELVRHAEDHDAEGALEAYVSMSRSCVRCHQLIRDHQ